jgi:hypothetical protein
VSGADVAAYREYLVRQCIAPWGEAAAVAVFLSFGRIAGDDRLARHVDRDGVDWEPTLADKTWSSGERVLLSTAAGLRNGRLAKVDISEVPFLDDEFFGVWQAMIDAARSGRVPEPLPSGGDA